MKTIPRATEPISEVRMSVECAISAFNPRHTTNYIHLDIDLKKFPFKSKKQYHREPFSHTFGTSETQELLERRLVGQIRD